MRALTFRERLREEAAKAAAAEPVDPWRLTLERVRGKVDFFDKLERITILIHKQRPGLTIWPARGGFAVALRTASQSRTSIGIPLTATIAYGSIKSGLRCRMLR